MKTINTSYLETFYEVTSFINNHINFCLEENFIESVIIQRHDIQGTGGLYEIAEEWTDEFEKLNEGREWDGEFFDELEDFCRLKNLKL